MIRQDCRHQLSIGCVVAGTFHGGEIEPGTFHAIPICFSDFQAENDRACMAEEQGVGMSDHDNSGQEDFEPPLPPGTGIYSGPVD